MILLIRHLVEGYLYQRSLRTVVENNEGATAKVSTLDEIRRQAEGISNTFNSDMRRRTIPLVNPTESLTVIGRGTLNYCSNYGDNE